MYDADMAPQVRKLKKAGYDLRTATGDDISEEDYAREHEGVRLRIFDRLQSSRRRAGAYLGPLLDMHQRCAESSGRQEKQAYAKHSSLR